MSARTSATGPAPFFNTPTTPRPPTPVVTTAPVFLSSTAMPLRGFLLLERKLGVGMKVLIQADQFIDVSGDPGIGRRGMSTVDLHRLPDDQAGRGREPPTDEQVITLASRPTEKWLSFRVESPMTGDGTG